MLIDSRRGSWFFIGLLLTTVEFQPDVPAVGGCGTCRKCIDACPTGALVFEGNRWQLDARRCISYLTIEHRGEFSAEQANWIGDWTFGCDVCQEVCPFNGARSGQPERAKPTTEPDFQPASELPPLSRLASLERREWDAITRGRALRRAGLEGLTRNAKANIANSNPIPPADSA
jgi:epoxyqueuosine reductase